MEDVLAVYTRPRDRHCPLVCLDETSKHMRVMAATKAGYGGFGRDLEQKPKVFRYLAV